jgi:hypothetical protein
MTVRAFRLKFFPQTADNLRVGVCRVAKTLAPPLYGLIGGIECKYERKPRPRNKQFRFRLHAISGNSESVLSEA